MVAVGLTGGQRKKSKDGKRYFFSYGIFANLSVGLRSILVKGIYRSGGYY
jgi:hypothetical protein